MTFFFYRRGLVVVRARLIGPKNVLSLRLALDTGATDTAISVEKLEWAGFDLSQATNFVDITMGGNVISAPLIVIPQIDSLGQTRTEFSVLAHTLPPTATVDGVLGLDFLRGHVLNIDFRLGKLTLE